MSKKGEVGKELYFEAHWDHAALLSGDKAQSHPRDVASASFFASFLILRGKNSLL